MSPLDNFIEQRAAWQAFPARRRVARYRLAYRAAWVRLILSAVAYTLAAAAGVAIIWAALALGIAALSNH